MKIEKEARKVPAKVVPKAYSAKLKCKRSEDQVPETISLYIDPFTVAKLVPTMNCKANPIKTNSK